MIDQHGSVVHYDVVVIGSGAAGLMCAITAGRRGRSVLLLEHNGRIGEKILVSGGGRCNFTNRHASCDNFHSANPDFCKSALARFTADDFIKLVESHGIAYHEKKLGQLFCNGSARQIVAMLQKECEVNHVRIETDCLVRSVEKDDGFLIATNRSTIKSQSLVIATGGLSIPKLGATDFGYRIAKQFEMGIIEPRPGLVPLVAGKEDADFCNELSGVSLEAIVSFGRAAFRENILFTHRGLSGPAILQVSSYWTPGSSISINLSPDVDLMELFRSKQHSSVELSTALAEVLPRRFTREWCKRNLSSVSLHHCSRRKLETIATQLHRWNFVPAGTGGFRIAEVTTGGIDTKELSSKTMEARKIPGLFFIGEVVDVTGHLGGYNFQWAWSSGFAAGQAA